MPLEKKLFTTGMDSDTEQRLVEPTSYRYALNVRAMSSDGSSVGAIENVKGNTLVTYTLPTGTNKVIGSYDYKAYNKQYYFVYNSNSNHSILEYTPALNTITKVLENSVLNFDPSYLITGINVVELDANNHLLYWTDNNEEPKKINIEKGILHSAGNFTQGYANPFLAEFIYRIKAPMLCEPSCVYASDATKNVNLLDKKLFQFKTQYIYDDFEKSATSPISVVPFPNVVCSNSPAPSVNNNIQITVDTGSTLVTKILIHAREGNTGDFFQIVELDKSLLGIASNTTYTYAFYNDKVYNTIDINQSIKLFDNVPLKSKAQELIEGERIVDGNILEGFDPVPVDATLSLSFEPDPSPATFGFRGRIFIGNFFYPNPEYQYCQPIHDLSGTGASPVFGGFGVATDGVVTSVGTDYGQTIPLKGFVVFLAGTNYYAISKQSAPTNIASTPGGLLADNVFNSNSGGGKRAAIRNAITNEDVYSEFTFSGVPPGKYIMRIASHLTTEDELGSSNMEWQKTSTNTMCVAGATNHECSIEITSNGVINISESASSTLYSINSSGYLRPSMVMDLTDPRLGFGSQAITGYVTDKDISVPTATTEGYLADTRIEIAKVEFSNTGLFGSWKNPMATAAAGNIGFVAGNSSVISSDLASREAFTDHNGYFYICENFFGTPGSHLAVDNIYSGANNLTETQLLYGSLSQVQPTPFPTVTGSEMVMGIFRNNDATGAVQNYSRTMLNGNVAYKGNPIAGVNAITTRGNYDTTDANGDFGLIVYIDTRNSNPRNDRVFYGVADNCIAVFTPNSDVYSISIVQAASGGASSSPYNGTYNNPSSNPFHVQLASVIVASILGSGSSVSFKRGSIEQFGIVYYDHGNRSGLTNTDDAIYNAATNPGLKLEIPFFTEINPATLSIYGQSRPVISWAITSQPPIWATHWQWVRTLNSVPNRYLQWTAKYVYYLTEDRKKTTYTQGVKIGLDITSILNYKDVFHDSQIAYVPEIGDRIRFIKDHNGNFFNKYYDFSIRDIDAAGLICVDAIATLPELYPGFLFEIYTPKLKSDNSIYYEFGECYEVINPGTANRAHEGSASNQNLSKTWNFTTHYNTTTNSIDYFAAFSSNVQHSLSVGDVITIVQNPGFLYSYFNATATVTTVSSPFAVITDLRYDNTTPPVVLDPGVIYVSATGEFTGGDTYSRIRQIPYGGTSAAFSTSNKIWYIEDASFSDFYKSKVQDIGRPNKVDNTFRQVRRKSTIYYSDKFIPETKINGLSSVYDTSFETYEAQYGGIQKLYNEDLRLDCYQELKVGAIPVNQVQFQSTDVTGASVVGASDNVLNPIRYYQGEYGISLNPESFAQYGGARYFFDVNRGAVLRLSNDGLTVISDYKMRNYFLTKSRSILAFGLPINVYGVFDVRFGEYILAFETSSSRTINPAPSSETLAFNEKYNAWSTYYSYFPENICSSGVDIISFKGGSLYTHNSNSVYNNFYGVQYTSEVWPIINGEPSSNKSLQAISEECPVVWEAYDISTENGQSTNLIAADFETKQNLQYAGVLRDVNSPNIVNPLIEGDEMVDTSFLIKLRNSLTTYVKMFAMNGYWQPSERSNK